MGIWLNKGQCAIVDCYLCGSIVGSDENEMIAFLRLKNYCRMHFLTLTYGHEMVFL